MHSAKNRIDKEDQIVAAEIRKLSGWDTINDLNSDNATKSTMGQAYFKSTAFRPKMSQVFRFSGDQEGAQTNKRFFLFTQSPKWAPEPPSLYTDIQDLCYISAEHHELTMHYFYILTFQVLCILVLSLGSNANLFLVYALYEIVFHWFTCQAYIAPADKELVLKCKRSHNAIEESWTLELLPTVLQIVFKWQRSTICLQFDFKVNFLLDSIWLLILKCGNEIPVASQ